MKRHRLEECREAPVLPGNRDFFGDSSEQQYLRRKSTYEREFQTLHFLSEFGKMPFPERDVHLMIAELRAIRKRVREVIRDRRLPHLTK